MSLLIFLCWKRRRQWHSTVIHLNRVMLADSNNLSCYHIFYTWRLGKACASASSFLHALSVQPYIWIFLKLFIKGYTKSVQIFTESWIANKKPSNLSIFIDSISKLNSKNESQADVHTCYANDWFGLIYIQFVLVNWY